MKQIKATCQTINYKTDEVISERLIGFFDNEDAASSAAHKARLEGECVAIYGCASQEEEYMSSLEMAEYEADWADHTRDSRLI